MPSVFFLTSLDGIDGRYGYFGQKLVLAVTICIRAEDKLTYGLPLCHVGVQKAGKLDRAYQSRTVTRQRQRGIGFAFDTPVTGSNASKPFSPHSGTLS